jgi:hypothetical protein
MDENSLQAIIGVIALLALLALIFIPVALFLGYAFFQKGKRNQIRQTILRERQQLIGNHRWFPIRYASERRFKEFFKIFPWEGAGIIVVSPGSVLFFGQKFSGEPETLQFAPGNSALTWLGKAPWPNGAVSWFYFTTAHEKYYFSSETGLLVFGSNKSTRTIYEAAGQSFSASRV